MSGCDPWRVPRMRLASIGSALRRARESAGHSLYEASTAVNEATGLWLLRTDSWCRYELGHAVPPPLEVPGLSDYVLQHARRGETGPFVPNHQTHVSTPSPARTDDPDTSHEAAASVKPWQARQVHWYVMELLDLSGYPGASIDERLWHRYRHQVMYNGWADISSPSGFRTRRNELVREGWVEDTGERAVMSTGRKAIVWGLTDLGRHHWKEHNNG